MPRVAIAYEELVTQLERGEIDLAWLPPIAFLRLKDQVRTLVVNQRQAYRCIVAVRASGRYAKLDDLRGARAAWVDPYSTTGYVLPLLDLVAKGVDVHTAFGEQRFFGSHDAAARAVFEGRSDLVGTFAEYDGERLVRSGLSAVGSGTDWRVLLRGSESPSDVLVARTSLDVEVCAALKSALSRAFDDEATARLVRDALHVEAFGEADDARYGALADTIARAHREGLLSHL